MTDHHMPALARYFSAVSFIVLVSMLPHKAWAGCIYVFEPLPKHLYCKAPNASLLTDRSSYAAPATIHMTGTGSAGDSDTNSLITSITFYNGGTALATVTNPTPSPSFSASYDWPSVGGGAYNLSARATDNGGAAHVSQFTNSATVTVTVGSNNSPNVSITAPASGTVVNAPASFTFAANASDSDGTVSSVAYYANGSYIGTGSGAGYAFTWAGVGAGGYSIAAVATDNVGTTTTSPAITVISNAIPAVSLNAPANGSSFYAPGPVTVAANASDSDGVIRTLTFMTAVRYFGLLPRLPLAFPGQARPSAHMR